MDSLILADIVSSSLASSESSDSVLRDIPSDVSSISAGLCCSVCVRSAELSELDLPVDVLSL